MALPPDYWSKKLESKNAAPPAPTTPAPQPAGPQVTAPAAQPQTPNLEAVNQAAFDEFYNDPANRNWTHRLNYSIASSIFPNLPPEEVWQKQMTPWQRAKRLTRSTGTLALNIITALPQVLIEAPQKVALSAAQGLEYLGDKAGLPKMPESARIPKSYNFGDFSHVSGFRNNYELARESGFGPVAAGVLATGEFTGDLAISADLVSAIRAGLKPTSRMKTPDVTGDDFTPMLPSRIGQINEKITPGGVTAGREIKFRDSNQPDISYFKLPRDVASRYKGNANNTYLKISPAGEGLAEVSVVQVRSNLTARTKDFFTERFGKSKVVEGPLGPELKLDTTTVKYNPENFVKPKTTSKPTATVPKERALSQAEIYGVDEATVARGGLENAAFADAELESQYQFFKNVYPKMTEVEDAMQFINKIKKGKSQFKGAPDRPLYSQAMSEDEVFTTFTERLNTERGLKREVKAAESAYDPAVVTDPAYTRVAQIARTSNTPAEFLGKIELASPTVRNLAKELESRGPLEEFYKAANAADQGLIPEAVVPEVPGVVQKPLVGLGDSLVTTKQLDQIRSIQVSKNINDDLVKSITEQVTGKTNLSELTQSEAFQVSETMRTFNKMGIEESTAAGDMIVRPWTHPTRYWMEAAEREMGHPIYSGVYLPMERGSRLSHVYARGHQDALRSEAVGAKYMDPKFREHRRLINAYTEGDKAAILNNTTLPGNVKDDLVRIGDWLNAQYKILFEDMGISSDRWFGVYAPKIRERGGIFNLYKTGDLPPEIKPFFEFERQGMLAPLEDDAFVLFDIYTNAVAKKKFLAEPLERAKFVAEDLPEHLKNSVNDYIQEKLGYQGALERSLNDLGSKISKATGDKIPADVFKRIIDYSMTFSYAGALGLPRVMPIVRNYMQPLFTTYPELGPEWFVIGARKFFADGGLKPVKDGGFLVDMGLPYGGELAAKTQTGLFGKAAEKYADLNRFSMKPYSHSDTVSRGVTYHGVVARFEDAWSKFLDGKASYEQFENMIDMQGFNPTLQNVLRGKLLRNTKDSLKEAQDLMVQDILDRTQFPYRKGAESRLHYGLKGKLGLQFAQWFWEYGFTLKSWAARGQWDKFVRWYAMSAVIKRTMEEGFGVDATKWVGLGPMSQVPFGPLANAGFSLIKTINAMSLDFEDEVNKNWKDVTNSIKIFGGTALGIGKEKLQQFYRSIKRYEAAQVTSPDPEKPFGIWSSTGKLKRWVDFRELFMVTLGFQSEDGTEFSDKLNAYRKDKVVYDTHMQDALNSLVDGDFEKFDKMVEKYQLYIPDIQERLKSFQTPLDQRLFERAPLPLKEKYFELFYPSK